MEIATGINLINQFPCFTQNLRVNEIDIYSFKER